ncbi:MAG: (2Fe-2S) ferredoxin domain-containing protein [Pleurocapsa sp.]
MGEPKKVLICLGRSCRKYDSEQVFAAFRENLIPGIELVPVACLGQCGNGPMVLIESERIWYYQVHPDEVPLVVREHLQGKVPVKQMLYPKFHGI